MRQRPDFIVKFDMETEPVELLTKRILYRVFIRRLRAKKPVVCFISADSGEGKSMASLRLQELMLDMMGLQLKDYVNDINVYTPLQYAEKLERILYDKRLKKIPFICMHEAREVVKAKNWSSFLNQSVADVNAMSRAIKRLGIFIISQFIRDISTDIRYTINFYCTVQRGLTGKSKLKIFVLWKDDRDLEKPKLRKRRLWGFIIDKEGRWKRFTPTHLEMSLPNKEVRDIFDQSDYDAKSIIIKRKLNKLIEDMKADAGMENIKIEKMVDWYLSHPEQIALVGSRKRGQFKLRKEVRELHNMTPVEEQMFSKMMLAGLEKTGRVLTDGHTSSVTVDDILKADSKDDDQSEPETTDENEMDTDNQYNDNDLEEL